MPDTPPPPSVANLVLPVQTAGNRPLRHLAQGRRVDAIRHRFSACNANGASCIYPGLATQRFAEVLLEAVNRKPCCTRKNWWQVFSEQQMDPAQGTGPDAVAMAWALLRLISPALRLQIDRQAMSARPWRLQPPDRRFGWAGCFHGRHGVPSVSRLLVALLHAVRIRKRQARTGLGALLYASGHAEAHQQRLFIFD